MDGPGLKFADQNAIKWNASKMYNSIVMKGNGLNRLTVQTRIQSKIRVRISSGLMGQTNFNIRVMVIKIRFELQF